MSEAIIEAPVPKIHKSKGGHQCVYVDYHVRRPDGVTVNEIEYRGTVNVPSCLANILSEQDQHWEIQELTLMSNKGNANRGGKVVAEFRG